MPKDWPTGGAISFKNVDLRYRPNCDLVLEKLSFDTKAGHKVGVVGRTGSGKSTFCLALCRIMEIDSGEVKIDNISAGSVELTHLRSKITVIPQDPIIFDGTLKFNLDPSGTVPDAEILALLKDAGLDDLLKRTPEKKHKADPELDTNEDFGNGRGIYFKLNDSESLSAGEKQLICICRAVLRKNKIVVLDEATANIDIVTEEKIQKLMKKAFAQSTVFTIAHRINTIINSDKVMVLDAGKCIEYDDPQKLSKDPKSEFSKLISDLAKEKKGETKKEEKE